MTALSSGRIQVHLDFGAGEKPTLIGQCAWYGKNQVAAFEWSEQALAMAPNVSPLKTRPQKTVVLAKRDPFGGLHGMLSDSIPDGFGLRLMNNSFRSAGYDLAEVTPIHRLSWVGRRGVGALTYSPEIKSGDAGAHNSLLDIESLGLRAQQADSDEFSEIPEAVIRAGGSALGARPKFWAAVHRDGKKVMLGDGVTTPTDFTPCLVKFAPWRGEKSEPYIEAACLQLANKHGVRAASARLLSHPGGAALAVERFDRRPGGARLHMQSLAALLDNDFRIPTLDYEQLVRASRALCASTKTNQIEADKAGEAERIYRQACFNVALSIRDDHSKNFAFLMDKNGRWELSPAFDLCPSEGPGGWHTMSVNGEAQRIGREDLLKFAEKIGLSESIAKEGIDSARLAAVEFEPLAISMGATKACAKRWAKVFMDIGGRLAPAQVQAPSLGQDTKVSRPRGMRDAG